MGLNRFKLALVAVLFTFFILYLNVASPQEGPASNNSRVKIIGNGQNFTKENSLTFDNGVFSFNDGEITFSLSQQVSNQEGDNIVSAIDPANISHKIEDHTNHYKFDADIQIPETIRDNISQITLNINSKKPIEKFSETAYRIDNYVIDFSDTANVHSEKFEPRDIYPEEIEGKDIQPFGTTAIEQLAKKNIELLDNGKIVFNNVKGKSALSIDPIITLVGDINQNTTWLSGYTYFVTVIVNVENGATLTIQPGAIIKFIPYATYINITANGIIIAKGTPKNKIHFTSCRDQSIGEDLSSRLICNTSVYTL